MRIQEAAELLLKEEGAPLTSQEIAKRALDRGMVTSTARDPIFSHKSTIDKNIREGIYNKPELRLILTKAGRFIGLPAWDKKNDNLQPIEKSSSFDSQRTISLKISEGLFEKIQLATQAKIADGFDATAICILKRGLIDLAPAIRAGLANQLSKLDDLK
ncbi:MAG: hypothetical protein IT362_10515 [Deltaproteobacteria bacterium]|nr:hypothetical protein [Deltaproteobacteria bacterium]